jgi:thiol:disulfide interchange protein DsbD
VTRLFSSLNKIVFMNRLFLIVSIFFIAGAARAQSEPVKWSFSAKKISDKVYEVQMTANLNSGWHIYSQSQPRDAIAIPTKFAFSKNPLVNLDGKVRESGKMEKYKDPALSITAHQYSRAVSFIQKVTLKARAKTSLTGTVEYQLCDDSKCLPPKKIPFSVSVG